jgi:hypothetical protein
LTPRLQILATFLSQYNTYKAAKRVSDETFPVTNPILPVLKSSMEATTMQGSGGADQRQLAARCLKMVSDIWSFELIEPICAGMGVRSLHILLKEGLQEVGPMIDVKNKSTKE